MKPMIGTVIILFSTLSASAQYSNLLNNPNFNTGIDHWIEASDAQISWDPANDAHGYPNSGSIVINQVFGDLDGASVFADCVPIQAETEVLLGGWFFVDGSEPGEPHVMIQTAIYDAPDCTGTFLQGIATNNIASTDQWFMKSTYRVIETGAVSAQFIIIAFNDSTDAFQVHGDTMFIIDLMPLFDDGFESSDTSAWSTTVP